MVEESKSARIYRFGEYVAFRVGGSEQLYIGAALARQLSEELARYAADIAAGVRFTDSKLGTITVEGCEFCGAGVVGGECSNPIDPACASRS